MFDFKDKVLKLFLCLDDRFKNELFNFVIRDDKRVQRRIGDVKGVEVFLQ